MGLHVAERPLWQYRVRRAARLGCVVSTRPRTARFDRLEIYRDAGQVERLHHLAQFLTRRDV